MVTTTKQGRETSEPITFCKGLPQGDALCPMLFTIFLNPVAWKIIASEGYKLFKPICAKVTDLLYIDNMNIFASSECKASDTLGDFIRRSPRSAKIARCARCSDCDFRRSPRSAYKIADIWHVRYRRLNSPSFPKFARSRDFLRSSLRIASKVNQSGWAILSHEQC